LSSVRSHGFSTAWANLNFYWEGLAVDALERPLINARLDPETDTAAQERWNWGRLRENEGM